jgi:hypothetical protein
MILNEGGHDKQALRQPTTQALHAASSQDLAGPWLAVVNQLGLCIASISCQPLQVRARKLKKHEVVRSRKVAKSRKKKSQ